MNFGDGIDLRNTRISDEDAARQTATANVLLRRLADQPGVILADEVGMGKTFVAMAVAVSTILARPDAGPVVVMVPSTLKDKWPRDWNVFQRLCLKSDATKAIRATSARTGVDFLKLLDDPVERRSQIIFLSHGVLNRSLQDHWVRLALIQRAFKGRSSLRPQRDTFHKFAGRLLREQSRLEARVPGILGDLLERPSETWRKVLHRAHPKFVDEITDDPVPKTVQDVLDVMPSSELSDLVKALGRLPLRESANIDSRIQEVRRELSDEMRRLWDTVLRRAEFSSPLLILDEAHHLKNPETKFASLFMDEEAQADSDTVSTGPLASKFDRMLFLTATPFQLGHAELVRVLERFQGIRWNSDVPSALSREEYGAALKELGDVMDTAQGAALRLERAWGRLEPRLLMTAEGDTLSPDVWWRAVASSEPGDAQVTEVLKHVEVTTALMRKAEECVGRWVIRNVKVGHLPGLPDVPRRVELPGASILEGTPAPGGLSVSGDALLPFLLAGRAQILLAMSERGRALFADGLASSFEAYRETRQARLESDEVELDEPAPASSAGVEWYLRHLDKALPAEATEAYEAHPKIAATVDRVARLWLAGEKVLVFCHYRATGRALRRHISQRLQEEILNLASRALPGVDRAGLMAHLDEVGNRFFKETTLRRQVDDLLADLVGEALAAAGQKEGQTLLTAEEREKVVEVMRRFLRTPSFLVRYFPLADIDRPGSVGLALAQTDHSGVSLRAKLLAFCEFLASRTDEERFEYLDALDSIQTGSYSTEEVERLFDVAERDDGRQPIRLPNVRLVNGESRPDTRRRVLLGFNTPLFPEILVASSVLAEGVDLHLNCRYVIHHDLCWNPSTLEQRSGRVDRIGSKAEQVKDSIHLYLPYVAATRDEKMFRVVKDRERWFQIVLGEKYQVDELALDKAAERIELPDALRAQLALRLH
ncbi:MAG: hypothetical protein ABS80_20675 [Pseudonocardia sp. SCN 72-51]|nr:MAG: hypothetical protein ABS80_20675 [Pseudonocardia sp. SCN 72-51]